MSAPPPPPPGPYGYQQQQAGAPATGPPPQQQQPQQYQQPPPQPQYQQGPPPPQHGGYNPQAQAPPPPPTAPVQQINNGAAPPPPAVPQQQQQYQQGPPPPQPASSKFADPAGNLPPPPPQGHFGAPPPQQAPQQQFAAPQQHQGPPPPQGPPQPQQTQAAMPPPPQQQQFQQGPPPPTQGGQMTSPPQVASPTGYPQQQYQQPPQQGGPSPQFAQQPPQQGGPSPAPQQFAQQPLQQQRQTAPPATVQHGQRVGQAPNSPVESINVHNVTLTKANVSGKIANNESIPRLGQQQREMETAKVSASLAAHIKPCSTQAVRFTTPTLPSTPQMADQFALPTGVIVRPMVDTNVPLVDFAAVDPSLPLLRCKRCRAYINPYCTFSDNGHRWQCGLCRSFNECPKAYYSPLNPQTGLREDITSRPELCNGTCDMVAQSEYMVRPPQRATWLFMFDVSYNAVQSGMLREFCEGLLDVLEELKDDDSIYVSFMAFDSVIYLFNMRSSQSTPKMIVTGDVVDDVVSINENNVMESVELPVTNDDLIVPLADSYDLIVQLLEKLPTMFENTQNVECAFGPAINTAITLLQGSGGKIATTLGVMPSLGEGRLTSRADRQKLVGQPKEFTLCKPATDWYKDRSMVCSTAQISVDLFANGDAELDLASIAPITRYTGGHIYRYTALQKPGGMKNDVINMLRRDTGFESVLRIRTSPVLSIPNFFGHFYVRGPDLLALPMCDTDTAMAMQFALNSNITSNFVCIQFALLYTTRTRERRIRVHTAAVNVSNSLTKVYNQADSIAMSNMLTKMCIDSSVTNSFQAAQQKINDKVVKSLKTFKKMSGGGGGGVRYASHLQLPQTLMYMPSLLAGAFRTPAARFLSTMETKPDDRVASMSAIMTAPCEALLSTFAPIVFTVYSPRHNPSVLPITELATQEVLRQDSIFLIDCGAFLVTYIGKAADSSVASEFGFDLDVLSPASPSSPGVGAAVGDEELAELVIRYKELVAERQALSNSIQHTPVVPVVQSKTPYAIEGQVWPYLLDDDLKESLSIGGYLYLLQRKVATAD